MTPFLVNFYIYAETEDEAKQLEKSLHDFVSKNYNDGIIVRASKVSQALNTFGSNYLVKQFLK